MTRRIILLPAVTILFTTALTFPSQQALASGYVASAVMQDVATPSATSPVVQDNRTKILQAYLEQYNSPLSDYAQTFIDEADKNQLDWKLVASISGVESYFGQQIPVGSYNGWGFGIYGKNVRSFNSWIEAIHIVSTALRSDYINKWGAQNIYQIGHIYAADPLWATKVSHFIAEIESFEQKYQDPKPNLSLNL